MLATFKAINCIVSSFTNVFEKLKKRDAYEYYGTLIH